MGAGAEWVADRSQTEHKDERRRVTVSEAAHILGITAEAVRTRIKRGRLDSVKDPPKPGGTVYVLLESDQTRPNTDPTSQGQDQATDQTSAAVLKAKDEAIEDLRDRVAFLEQELERRGEETRHLHQIVAGLTRTTAELSARIPQQLEAPQDGTPEPRESPESPGPRDTPPDAGGGLQTVRETPFTQEEEPPQRRGFWSRLFGGS